jgi:hypothetical protein
MTTHHGAHTMTLRDRDQYYHRAGQLYLTYADAVALRRANSRLQRWHEDTANGVICRDDDTGQTYRVYGSDGPGPLRQCPTPDREKPAIRTVHRIAQTYGATAHICCDPRGQAVSLRWPDGRRLDPA